MNNQFFYSPNRIFPIIEEQEFVLREKQESDVTDFFAYYSDPQVNQFILCEIPQTLEEAKKELSYWRNIFYRNDGIYFAIALKSTNKIIGSIGLTGYNSYHNRIEISYDLAKEYWGKGIMTRAILKVADYGFNQFAQNLNRAPINRIEAFTAVNNIASKNLLLKCGFELEGTLRQHRFHKENFVDVFSFSLLADDI
jgi:[ribosomal protein S5]-alanine N-acetyltransferase